MTAIMSSGCKSGRVLKIFLSTLLFSLFFSLMIDRKVFATSPVVLDGGVSEWEYLMCRELSKTSVSSDDYALLLQVVMAEAGNQSYEGKLAVAQIILYRASKYNMSIHDVVHAKGQFSVIGTRLMHVPPDKECVWAVDDALFGCYVLDPEIEFFCSGRSGWHEKSLVYAGTIGDHRFYKK